MHADILMNIFNPYNSAHYYKFFLTLICLFFCNNYNIGELTRDISKVKMTKNIIFWVPHPLINKKLSINEFIMLVSFVFAYICSACCTAL